MVKARRSIPSSPGEFPSGVLQLRKKIPRIDGSGLFQSPFGNYKNTISPKAVWDSDTSYEVQLVVKAHLGETVVD